MTIQDYLCKLLACGILFSQLNVTVATITWTLPPPQRGPLLTSDTSVRTTIQKVINRSSEAHLTWNFTFSGEILDRVTFEIGGNRIGKKTSSGIVLIDPTANFQEHFDISRSDPATLIIYNVTEADEAVFSCKVETDARVWSDRIQVQIVAETSFTGSLSGDQTVNEGSHLNLFCDATGKPTPNVTWTRVLLNGTDGEVKFFGNPWVIVNISRTASGKYRCTAYNGIGNPMSHTLYIDVTYQPDMVTLITNTTENKDCSDLWVNFTCISSEANPPVYNYLLSDGEDGFSLSKSGTWIKKISRGGKSIYNCLAFQLVENVTSARNITLTVNVPASVQQVENKNVIEGENVEEYCIATAGDVDPTEMWTNVTSGEHIEGNPLNITNINRAQAGDYKCTANNTCGEVSTVMNINVQYGPENVILTKNTTSKVCTGVVINFTCIAEANPPVHTYLLYENDTMIKNMGISGSWMKTMENAGYFVFRCEANNSIQRIGKSGNTTLTVDVPASVEQVENKNVIEGNNVEEYCIVTAGIPGPTVMWTNVKTGEHIKENPLNITNINRTQAGEYKCTANNTCGVDSTVMNINVQYGPENAILTTNATSKVCTGVVINFICIAEANPPVHTYLLYENDTMIKNMGISGTWTKTMENAGHFVFRCEANNSIQGIGKSGNTTFTVDETFAPTTITTLPRPTTKVVESTISARATIDEGCDERLDVEKRFPSLACERVRHLGCLSAQAVASRCGSVIVDFEMKFNQSAVVSEVLNVLKTAAEEDNFDGFKVDPNSIEQVSPPPTDTSDTKATEECKCSCNDVILAAVVGVLVFVIIGLILYIVWLHKKGTACRQRHYKEERDVYDNEMALDDLQPSGHIPSKSTQSRSEYMDLTEGTRHNEETQRVTQSTDYAPLYPSTRSWEVEKQHVTIEKIIGKGAFGQVAKGTATGLLGRPGKTTVAVKMLKYNSPESDRRDLLRELDTMKQLKPHPHVIKLLGCVTETEPLMVIIEYVPYGDLLGYLRKSRGLNDTYYKDPDIKPQTSLTSQQLMKFAWQIADGMSYLSSKSIIHRDLAARNVLVGERETCKVTDFGMARDVQQDNIYEKKTKGRLPVKWTAYEALLYGTYTTKSDIWSYGVVLYEIFTIGGSPYPRVNGKRIASLLQEGYRMPKPQHVDDKLYEIMLKCWQNDPDVRPTFSELKNQLKDMENQHKRLINLKMYDHRQLYANVEDLVE